MIEPLRKSTAAASLTTSLHKRREIVLFTDPLGVVEKQRDGGSVAAGFSGDEFVRAVALFGERPKRKRVGVDMMHERRPKLGHSTLLALLSKVGEQTAGIENSEPLAIETRLQQPDRYVGAVDAAADDCYRGVSHIETSD